MYYELVMHSAHESPCEGLKQLGGFSDYNVGVILFCHDMHVLFCKNVTKSHTRLKIWYKPCIIRQYLHSKTAASRVLFSNSLSPVCSIAMRKIQQIWNYVEHVV